MDQAVNSFRSLLSGSPGEEPGVAQRRVATVLPERVKASNFDWWPTDAVPNGTGNRLLIGVAIWSGSDLTMLDLLENAVLRGKPASVPVGVFDIDQLLPADLERLLPGLGVVHHSPVVGFWERGELVEKACGFQAREIVSRLFGLDPKDMIDHRIPARV